MPGREKANDRQEQGYEMAKYTISYGTPVTPPNKLCLEAVWDLEGEVREGGGQGERVKRKEIDTRGCLMCHPALELHMCGIS